MYYKELARRLRRRYLDSLGNVVLQKPADVYSDCNHAATAITDLLARAEAAEARAEKAERERDAAVKELNEVAEAVDGLSDFIDEQVHPLVSYDIYTALRENADAISVWQYESEWRGQEEE